MDENIRRVLQLVQEGKITAKEAEPLIAALTPKPAPAASGEPPRPAVAPEPFRPVTAPEPPRPSEPPQPSETPWSLVSPHIAAPEPPSAVEPAGPVAASESPHPATAFASPRLAPAPEPPRPLEPSRAVSSDPGTARLATGDLLLQIADDPSIPENEKLNLIIHATALICTVLALQPIPGVDVFILTPILVASVMAMSHVMGIPIGKNGAGEIVASLAGVVGLGVIAEQFVLAGAKILLPFFGGLSLIPLVYAATYGMGWAARAVLDARRSDRQISDTEIRRIKEEAERRAKAEKRDWSLAALKGELDTWRSRAESYKQYESDYSSLYQKQSGLREEVERLSLEVAGLTERKMALQSRLAVQTGTDDLETGPLQRELDAINREWQAQGGTLDHKGKELNGVMWRLEALINARFAACYPSLALDVDVIDALALLPGPRINALERQVALLLFDPAKADYRGDGFVDSAGNPVRTVEFDTDGRLYVQPLKDQVVIRAVGSRRTEEKDIARLKRED